MNKLKELDNLIYEVLTEEPGLLMEKLPFDKEEFERLFGDAVKARGSESGEAKVTADDVWELPQKGDDPTKFNLDDIEWYKQNPTHPDFDVQVSKNLIAIMMKYKSLTGLDARDKIPSAPAPSQAFRDKIQSAIDGLKEKQREHIDKNNAAKKAKEKYRGAYLIDQYQTKIDKLLDDLEFMSDPERLHDLGLLAKAASEAEYAKQHAIEAASGRKQTVSAPSLKSMAGERGDYPPEVTSLIDRIFSAMPATDISSRMEHISSVSKLYFEAAKGSDSAIKELHQKPASLILAEVQLLDMFNSLAKEFEGGSGAYLFEYFLAAMAGGKIEGKETTEAGKMGATDFTMRDKDGNVIENGSAKYYSKGGGIGQAVGGFTDLWNRQNMKDGHPTSSAPKDVSITYVIGIKKQDVDQFGDTKRGTSDPQRLMAVEIYTPVVSYRGPEQGFFINDKPVKPHVPKSSKEKAAKKGGTPSAEVPISNHLAGAEAGVIYVAMVNTSTFREMIDRAVESRKTNAGRAYTAFKEYFDALEQASSGCKEYTNSGDISAGNKVYTNLETAETRFNILVKELEYEQEVYSDEYGPRVQRMGEGKMNKLDELILEVLKENLDK